MMFKKSSRPLITLAILGVFALLPAGYESSPAGAQSAAPQAVTSDAAHDAQVAQVLDNSVLRVGGMIFPKVTPPANAKMAGAPSCCTPGETRTVNRVAGVDLTSPHNYPRDKFLPAEGPLQSVYSPPLSCWVISSYSRVVESANTPYTLSDDAQPAGFKYLTSSEYQAVYESLKEYVGKMNILDKYKADLNLKLEEFVKNYGKYQNSISTSHGTARLTARLQGRGWPNGRSWVKAHLNVTEVCCPPEVRDAEQLKTTLKGWIDETAMKLPKSTAKDVIKLNPNAGPIRTQGPVNVKPAP